MSNTTDYIQKMIKEQESFRKMFGPSEYVQKLIEEQDSLRKMYEPPDYVRKMIKEQESLRKMFGPSEYVQKMFEEQGSLRKMYEPTYFVRNMIIEQESIRKMFGSSEHVQKMIEEQDSLRKMYEPPDYVRKMIEEQETFREMFAPRGSAATALQSLINQGAFYTLDITTKIKSLADELFISEFHINSDGIISLEEQSINVSELSIEVSTFFDELSEGCSTETVLSRLACLKKPAQRIAIWILNNIIIAFFVSVIAALSTPSLQNYFDSNSLKSRRQVTQTIKNLPPEIDIDEYKGFRVVTANILNLHQKPYMKSQVITKLKRGKLVRVIQKKKNWTKVEVENSDSCGTRVGWVATRHIVPLNREG